VRLAQAHAPGEEAGALLGLGRVLRGAGRSAEAYTALERAVALDAVDARRAPLHRADRAEETRRALALAALDLGRTGEARALLAAICGASQRPEARAIAEAALGQCDHDTGALDAARVHYEAAASGLRAAGLVAEAAEVDTLLGALCRAEGRGAEAYALLRRAVVALDDAGELERARRARLHLAGVEHQAGRGGEARRLVAAVREGLDAASVLHAEVAVVDAQIAGVRLAETPTPLPVTVRLARRCLPVAVAAPPRPLPPDDALLIGAGGAWFRPPHGERISLATRRPLARVLEQLAEARGNAPGRALAWEDLLAAGWPGEKVIASAGAHRVRVALSSLRKLGLRELLRTTEAGYALAPEVTLVRDDA
jgi:tetratricopeptide (TPR) repeat protein